MGPVSAQAVKPNRTVPIVRVCEREREREVRKLGFEPKMLMVIV